MKYLVVLLWPVAIVGILALGFLLARRHPGGGAKRVFESPDSTDGGALPPQPARPSGRGAMSARLAGSGWLTSTAGMLGMIVTGTALVFGVMAALGLLVVYHGRAIDLPIYNWILAHQMHLWVSVQNRLTKVGDTWTCWAATIAAAVCLAVTWRKRRWLPPALLSAAIVVDKFTTLALRHTFHRLGTPLHPLGTYPSGGCDRVIFLYGLIAYLLWREFSGRRTMAIWAGAVVAALGFNEGYSRVYLGLHWFTDVLSGLFYGGLLLFVFISAIRTIAGPASFGKSDGDAHDSVAAVGSRASAVTTGAMESAS